MPQISEEDFELIKDIINDWSSDCPGTDWEKVQELRYKFGMDIRPTPEELAEQERKRKEFAETPFMHGHQWPSEFRTATELRVKLPNAYLIKDKEKWLTKMSRAVLKIFR